MSPYYTLEEGQFRLLTFLDDTGTTCQLQDFAIQTAPPYIALSHTWGQRSYQKGRPSSLTYYITLSGASFEVR